MSSPATVPVANGALPVESVKEITKADLVPTHPLDSLTPEEIRQVSYALRAHVAEHHKEIKAVKFVNTAIIAPPKRDVLAFLGIPSEPGKPAEKAPKALLRRAETAFIDPVNGPSYNATLQFDKEKGVWFVENVQKLPEGTHPQVTVEELILCDELVRKDEKIIKLAAEVGVSAEQLYADGWSIGWDARWPEAQRIQQCLLFARLGPHENLYAHPLDFVPVIDVNSMKVIHVDFAAHRLAKSNSKINNLTASGAPPALNADPFTASGRERIPPPLTRQDYLPDLIAADPNQKPKVTPEPLKPLHVSQPEGVSFKMVGTNALEWAGWKMHVGFGQREGLVMSAVTFDDDAGVTRPVMYRMSLVEMVVPYAAPEHPHPRKFAFDVGEYGMGTQVNELTLGCDCLGTIHYLPGAFVSHDGTPVVIKRAICIHEEDAGLLWKHTDFRPGGRAHSVRSRRLVVQMVCTLANYEYLFAYRFYLDGTIEFEVGLSGMLQTYLLAKGESPDPHGVQISPGVNAQYHQHIFSLRVDPMVDGLKNTVVQSDIVPLSHPAGSEENFAGNGFTAVDTRIVGGKEVTGVRDYETTTERRWRIVNPSKRHYASGREASYGIIGKGAWVALQSAKNSWARQRAAFLEHAVWVVEDVEGPEGSERQWPAGKYVPQTRGAPPDSLGNWVKDTKDGSLENTDVVLFLTVGVTHVPRPEDWPVMPVQHFSVMFKPQNFFDRNPSLHVAGGRDERSVAAFEPKERVEAGVTAHTHDNSCCH